MSLEGNKLLEKINLEYLMVCPQNLRKHYREEDIDELAESLEKVQREDIHVHWSNEDKKWHIMSGQRRYLASLKSGKIDSLMCRKHPEIANEEEAESWCLEHELERRELSPLDIHEKVKEMEKEYGNLKRACDKKGFTKTQYERLRKYLFRNLTPEAKEELFKLGRKLSLRKVTEISRLESSEQFKMIKQISSTSGLGIQEVSPRGNSSHKVPILTEIKETSKEILEKRAKEQRKKLEPYCGEILDKEAEKEEGEKQNA